MGHNFKPSIVTARALPAAEVQHASLQAARLIESAMHRCNQNDLLALDCLLEARRALSPIVDMRKETPKKPSAK